MYISTYMYTYFNRLYARMYVYMYACISFCNRLSIASITGKVTRRSYIRRYDSSWFQPVGLKPGCLHEHAAFCTKVLGVRFGVI